MRLARTFVPDLLEELFNRCVSRFIFHDDQNLRRGIARGRQNRLSWGVPIGRGKSRPLRWKLSKLPPIGCRSENGRGIAPRRNPSRATHLEAFRKLWSGRPDEILGRRARMHHAGLHLPRTSGVRFGFTSSSSSRLATRKRTSGKVSPRVPPRWDETGNRSDPPRERVVVGNSASRPLRRSRVRPGC